MIDGNQDINNDMIAITKVTITQIKSTSIKNNHDNHEEKSTIISSTITRTLDTTDQTQDKYTRMSWAGRSNHLCRSKINYSILRVPADLVVMCSFMPRPL